MINCYYKSIFHFLTETSKKEAPNSSAKDLPSSFDTALSVFAMSTLLPITTMGT